MGSEALLDTNIVVRHLRKKPSSVTAIMATIDQLYISETVLGELYYGAYHGDQTDRELTKIQDFLRGAAILYHDSATAELYGQVAAKLTKAGNVIPQNDLWIAAIALETGLPLATSDKHFERVEGLTVLDWTE